MLSDQKYFIRRTETYGGRFYTPEFVERGAAAAGEEIQHGTILAMGLAKGFENDDIVMTDLHRQTGETRCCGAEFDEIGYNGKVTEKTPFRDCSSPRALTTAGIA